MLGSDLFIAAAIGAERLAKRQVYIQTDTLGRVPGVKLLPEKSGPFVPVQPLLPERNGWITGIAGNRQVILCQKSCWKGHVFFIMGQRYPHGKKENMSSVRLLLCIGHTKDG